MPEPFEVGEHVTLDGDHRLFLVVADLGRKVVVTSATENVRTEVFAVDPAQVKRER